MRALATIAVLLWLTAVPLRLQTFDGKDVRVVPARTSPAPGTKIAVVVGVHQFKYLPGLEFADDDARDVAQALAAVGYTVRSLRMDTEKAPYHPATILTEIEQVCKNADPQDTILLFLSGHGFSEAGRKEPFFCTHYTDPEHLADTALSLEFVRQQLQASKARQKMLIVDACRNVPGERGISAKMELGEQFQAGGLGILFSTSPGKLSYEPNGVTKDRYGNVMRNGVFTHYWLAGFAGKADTNQDGWVTFRELSYYTWDEVKAQTSSNQKPYLDWEGEAGADILLGPLCRLELTCPASVEQGGEVEVAFQVVPTDAAVELVSGGDLGVRRADGRLYLAVKDAAAVGERTLVWKATAERHVAASRETRVEVRARSARPAPAAPPVVAPAESPVKEVFCLRIRDYPGDVRKLAEFLAAGTGCRVMSDHDETAMVLEIRPAWRPAEKHSRLEVRILGPDGQELVGAGDLGLSKAGTNVADDSALAGATALVHLRTAAGGARPLAAEKWQNLKAQLDDALAKVRAK